MSPKTIYELLQQTVTEWLEDKAPQLAAALAYYTIFSLAPLIIIVLGIVTFVLGSSDEAVELLKTQVASLMGSSGADTVNEVITAASEQSFSSSILATLIGLGTLIFAATGVFGQLQDAMNTIWEVQPKPGLGIMNFIRARFLSFAMILGIGFLLLVSLVLSAILAALGEFLAQLVAGSSVVIGQIINNFVSFGVITLLFALIFKMLPDAQIAWRDVWLGAAVTALLFTVGKFFIGLYLGNKSFGSTYGAAGSLLILLLWVYYSAQILLFGAEFTQVYARRFGSRIVPDEHAVRVETETKIVDHNTA